MRQEFVSLLACPDCSGRVQFREIEDTADDGHVMTGTLQCEECKTDFPIEGGVPRLLPMAERRAQLRDVTAERFAYEWTEFADFDVEEEEKSLITWMQPNSLDRFKGQIMFEAGCGMGRHSVVACRNGVKQHVGLDLGASGLPVLPVAEQVVEADQVRERDARELDRGRPLGLFGALGLDAEVVDLLEPRHDPHAPQPERQQRRERTA